VLKQDVALFKQDVRVLKNDVSTLKGDVFEGKGQGGHIFWEVTQEDEVNHHLG
jgi:hypothetical protein